MMHNIWVKLQKSAASSLRWDDIPLFLAAARAGSLAGAARLLRLDQTTVGRRLTAMEERLGALILARRHGRLGLTALGEALLPHAEAMELAAYEFGAEAASERGEPRGEVRLSAPPTLSRTVLAPALADLGERYPRLTLVLTVEPANVRLEDWEADISLRLALPTEPSSRVMASRLGSMAYAVYGPANRPTADAWIAYGRDYDHTAEGHWVEQRLGGKNPMMRSNDPAVMAAAAAAGAGRALLATALGDNVPGLARQGPIAYQREVWLLWRRDLSDNPAVTAVIRWLRESCRPLLRGLEDHAP